MGRGIFRKVVEEIEQAGAVTILDIQDWHIQINDMDKYFLSKLKKEDFLNTRRNVGISGFYL